MIVLSYDFLRLCVKSNRSLAKTERFSLLLVDQDDADEFQKQAPIQIDRLQQIVCRIL